MATSMVYSSSTALVLALNLLFFSLVTSTYNCPPPPHHKHKPIHKPPPHHPTPTPKPPTTPCPRCPTPPVTPTPKPPTIPTPTPKPPTTPTPTPPVTPTPEPPTTPTPTPKPPTTPTPTPPVTPTPKPPTTPTPTPPTTPEPAPTPPTQESCPRDALKLGVCANVLGGLLTPVIGTPPKEPCCTLLNGLTDLEAAVCLCIAIKANLLGINLNVPVDLSLLLNYCGKETPTGFQCPN